MPKQPHFRRLGVRVLVSGLLLTQTPLSGQLPPGFTERWDEISSELRDSLEASHMVGSSWAFVADGELVALETFGFADLDTRRPVDEATIYHWGSITKTPHRDRRPSAEGQGSPEPG